MENTMEILILSVGGSPEPLIYSINEFQPDKVVFLHSPQTLYQCGIVLNKVDWYNEDNELSDYVNNFDKEIDDLKKRENIANYPSFEQIKSLKHYETIVDFIKTNLTNILEETNINDKIFIAEIPDSESLDESFAVSKEVFSKISNDTSKNIHVKVDFTGGTKPMVSGIVLGVIEGDYPNFDLSYVGSKDSASRDKNGVGIVKDGYEITKMQKDPYKTYAVTEFKRGKNFFNTYQFEAASQNFESAKTRVTDDEKKLASLYNELVILYKRWDTFNEKKSNKKKSKTVYEYLKYLIRQIDENKYFYNNLGVEFYNQLKNNLNFLSYKHRGVSLDSEDDLEKSNLKYRIQYYFA